MAEQIPQDHAKNPNGCFDFLTKNKEEKTEDVVMTDLNSKEEKKHTLMDELQRTHSHSSSSSDEEVDEGGERKKKKKKKGLEEGEGGIPIEKCSEEGNAETGQPEEKKGFLEKIKEKLPGQHEKGEDETQTPAAAAAAEHSSGSDNKEKKGILDKIKEKLPGHHKNNENEVEN